MSTYPLGMKSGNVIFLLFWGPIGVLLKFQTRSSVNQTLVHTVQEVYCGQPAGRGLCS